MRNWLKIIALSTSAMAFSQQAFTIDEAWNYAAEHNVNVQKAKIDRQIADQKVKETTGIGLPQIDVQGKYNYFLKLPVQLLPGEMFGGAPGSYIPVQFGQKQTASGGVTLSQLLFSGSYLVGLQSAKAYRETMALAEEKTTISVKEGIMLAYTGILVTDENIKTLEENRRIAEKGLHDTEETYKAGLIEYQNVEQLQYSYKSILANKENLMRTRNQLVMALKYVMGYPMDQEITLSSALPELIQKNEALFSYDEKSNFENHIDYRLGQNSVKLNELKVKLQQSKYLPTLAGFLSSTYNGNSNKFTFFDKDQLWFNTYVAGLQLDIPVFNGFQRKWQLGQAKLDLQKAKLDLTETQRRLKNDAYKSNTDYQNAYNSYKNAQELSALSSSIYKKQQIKFKEGMGTSLELQQAENQLYNSQSSYYQAALNLIQAKTRLDEALGNL